MTIGKLLSRKEASEYLKKRYGLRAKPATLAKYASIGGGPPFRRAGRFPVYDTDDLDAWALMRVSRRIYSNCELRPMSEQVDTRLERTSTSLERRQT